MSAEWVTAIATAGTFVVIAASAVAALLQLRHMRGSNQIVALTECRETMESREFQEARRFVRNTLPSMLQDPSVLRALASGPMPELYPANYIGNFFESMGGFVRFGIIDKTIACDLWCGVVYGSWLSLLPMTRIIRERDPGLWENFEYLAVLSQDFMNRHPTSFPKGMRRMPLDEPA